MIAASHIPLAALIEIDGERHMRIVVGWETMEAGYVPVVVAPSGYAVQASALGNLLGVGPIPPPPQNPGPKLAVPKLGA